MQNPEAPFPRQLTKEEEFTAILKNFKAIGARVKLCGTLERTFHIFFPGVLCNRLRKLTLLAPSSFSPPLEPTTTTPRLFTERRKKKEFAKYLLFPHIFRDFSRPKVFFRELSSSSSKWAISPWQRVDITPEEEEGRAEKESRLDSPGKRGSKKYYLLSPIFQVPFRGKTHIAVTCQKIGPAKFLFETRLLRFVIFLSFSVIGIWSVALQ